MGTAAQKPESHVCADCERFLEDDSPWQILQAMDGPEEGNAVSAPADPPVPAGAPRGRS